MPDREKVIKAIEACMYQNHPACCNECYLDGPGFGIVCREKLMRDALILLLEQGSCEYAPEQELVRCKDCTHAEPERVEDEIWCPVTCSLRSVDWFCADGERR